MSNIRSLNDVKGGSGGGGPPGGLPPGGPPPPGGGGGGMPFDFSSLFGGLLGGGGGGAAGGGHGHGRVKKVTSQKEFRAELGGHPRGLIVVDFSATWCGPCQRIAPIVAELSTTYPNVRFLEVDVDQLSDVAQECGVSAMPTFHFYLGGRKVDELRGADPRALEERIKRHGAGSVLSSTDGGGSGFGGTGYRLGGGDGGGESSTPAATSQTAAAAAVATPTTADTEAVVQAVVELGFSREAALAGIAATGTTDPVSVVDWVLQNAADIPAAAAAATTTTTTTTAAAAAAAATAGTGPKTTLAIRLTNGTTLKHDFTGGDTLRAVRDFVVRNRTDGNAEFELMTPFPRNVFGAADLDRTLAELELVPNANLVLHRR